MKKLIIPGIALIALGFSVAEGFLQTLEITKETAEDGVWNSFSSGSYSGPASTRYHSFAVPLRVAMVKEIGAFAKAYTLTDDFKNKYGEYREQQKPTPPEALIPIAEQKNKAKESIQKSLTEAETNMKNQTGEIRKAFEGAVTMMKEQLKQLDDPNNPVYSAQMESMQKQGHEASMKEYQDKLRQWEQEYPVSPTAMIKHQLTYFLQLSATVDFSAKLAKGEGDIMVFVNPEYENKPSDWKFIFRSGKESSDAARVVATQWLAELK